MYQELMIEAVKDRQARVRADVLALNDRRALSHPVRRTIGVLMVRLGQRLQSLGGDELALEPVVS
jgi:hypothetical protein